MASSTVPQVVSVRAGRYRPHYDLAPGRDVDQGDLVRAFLERGHGPTPGRRVRGLLDLVRALWRQR